MSRTVRLPVLAAVFAAVATPAGSQDLRALERQVDTLHAIAVARGQAVTRHRDSLAAVARRLDTVRVGTLVILAERGVAELAAQAGRVAVDSLGKAIGTAVNLLSGHAFVVRVDRPDRWEREDMERRGLDSTVLVSMLFPSGQERRAWRGRRTAEEVGHGMVHHALAALYLDSNREFAVWLANQIPNDSLPTMNWLTLRLNLASAIPNVSTRCFEGDIAACKLALGLTVAADPVTQWFDEPRRRRAVSSLARLARRLDPNATAQCLERHIDAACVAVMRMMPADRLPAATAGDARASLVRLALDRGGADAVDRLLADGSPLERIERAAGVPVDSVVAEWQRRVHHARASSRDVSGEIVLGSVMWIGLLLLASTRSSRWR